MIVFLGHLWNAYLWFLQGCPTTDISDYLKIEETDLP